MRNPTARALPLAALAGTGLFTLAWVTLGAISPGYPLFGTWISPYSPISQPVSGLGLGDTAAYMNTGFVVGGVLLVAGVIGTGRLFVRRRRLTVALLLAAPTGMIVCGVWTLEAMLPHLTGFLLAVGVAAVSLPLAATALPPPIRRRAFVPLTGGGLLALALLVWFMAAFDPVAAGSGHGIAGLIQRALILDVHACLAALGWLAFRSSGATTEVTS